MPEAVTLLLLLIPAPSCGGGTPGPAATIAAPCPCAPASLCDALPRGRQPPLGTREQAIFVGGDSSEDGGDIASVLPFARANITSVSIFGANSFAKVKCESHRHGARAITLLSLSPGGAGVNLSSAAYRRSWVNESLIHLATYGGGGWDGATLDVEGFDDTTERAGLTQIVCELRAAMSAWLAGSQLSFCSSMDPDRDSQYYDYHGISSCIDFFVPMGYDLGAGQPSANSPLPAVRDGLRKYLAKPFSIPSSKIVLALPLCECVHECIACQLPPPMPLLFRACCREGPARKPGFDMTLCAVCPRRLLRALRTRWRGGCLRARVVVVVPELPAVVQLDHQRPPTQRHSQHGRWTLERHRGVPYNSSPWFDYIDYKFSNRPRGGAWGSIPADADSTQQWESGRPHPPGYIEYTNTKVGCIAKSCTIRIAHVATV